MWYGTFRPPESVDTINHPILLDELSVMGFSSEVIAWFNSYLSERVQRVEIDEESLREMF